MSDMRNIDNLFKDASKGFAPKTPHEAWGRIESSLKKQRRRKILFWWVFSLTAISIALLVSTFFVQDIFNFDTPYISQPKSNYNIKEKIELKDAPPASSSSAAYVSESQQHLQDANSQKSERKSSPNNRISTFSDEKSKPMVSVKETKSMPNDSKILEERFDNDILNEGVIPENDSLQLPEVVFYNQTTPMESKENHVISSEDSILVHSDIMVEFIQNVISDTIVPVDSVEKTVPPSRKCAILFFTELYMGFGFSGALFQQPDNQIETVSSVTELRNSYTNTKEFAFGVFWNKWMISSSLSRINFRFQGDLNLPSRNIKYIDTENFGTSPMGYFSLYNIQNVMQGRHYSNIDYLRHFDRTRFELYTTQVGLKIGRVLPLNNWQIVYGVGVNTLFINSNVVAGSDEFGYTDWGSVSNLRGRLFMVSPFMQLNYYTRSGLFLGLKSDFSISLESLNKSSEFYFKPYSLFVGPKLGFRF
ncbi:MAG: hypothetical protein JXR34_02570 [Bacteroidales bacterium]|nr:hypothetical protein [Bacteroidales bacterium]